jgi:large subunit ribosomal protein L6
VIGIFPTRDIARISLGDVAKDFATDAGSARLAVGYSHPVLVKPRKGISFDVPVPTQVVVKGIDKQMVGQTAAEVRKVRPPEPYKGKGIRYRDEQVRRKVGKRA